MRVVTALLAVPLAGSLLGGVPAAQAAADPDLTISQVTLDRTSVAVSGLNTYPINVTVKGGCDSSEPGDANLVLNVVLERTGGTGQRSSIVSADLKRTAGTVQITAAVNPRVVPFGKPYSITWAVTNTATGKPYGTRIPIGLGVDTPCAEGGSPLYKTGTNGVITKAYTAGDAGALNCAHLYTDPYYIAGQWLFPARPAIVAAVPSKTSAPVGTVVPVNGSVAYVTGSCPVQLQRLYGRTQWRTVSTGAVRQSGRFTVNAQPPYKGLIPYRVSFPACQPFVAGLSKTFTIRGI